VDNKIYRWISSQVFQFHVDDRDRDIPFERSEEAEIRSRLTVLYYRCLFTRNVSQEG
jgi:hypothetical protein